MTGLGILAAASPLLPALPVCMPGINVYWVGGHCYGCSRVNTNTAGIWAAFKSERCGGGSTDLTGDCFINNYYFCCPCTMPMYSVKEATNFLLKADVSADVPT